MYLLFHSVNEPSENENHDIFVWVLFSSLRGGFGSFWVLAHFYLLVQVWFGSW